MIYLVFALVLTAALLYLFLPARAVENVEQPSPAVGEQRAALRRQLAELEYEFSLGRINKQDFDRQQAELLVAWVELEKKAQEPRQENCRQCGTLLLAGARFCHHCGTRVAQLAFLVLFFLDVSSLQALDIVVNIHNGTYGTPERSPVKVQLLQLAGSMQPVGQTVAHNGHAQFRNIPESPDSPYMVQANYQNVNYSQVIPPLARSPVHVTLEVFASTDSTENLSVRPLVELRRVAADRLSGLLILFFRNSGKRTYFSKDGIIFSLPATATFEQVSVSVGSGKSDIQWLKVAAEATDKPHHWRVMQPIKPGERVLQVLFRLPYTEGAATFEYESFYRQETGLQLLAEPGDLEVSLDGKPLTRHEEPALGRGVISFPSAMQKLTLQLRGGGILKDEDGEVIIKSVMALWQKLFFPALALLLFFAGFLLESRLRKKTTSGA